MPEIPEGLRVRTVELKGRRIVYDGMSRGEISESGLRYTSVRNFNHFFYKYRGYGMSTDILTFLGVNFAYDRLKGIAQHLDSYTTTPKILVDEIEIVAIDASYRTSLVSRLWKWSPDVGLAFPETNPLPPKEAQQILPVSQMTVVGDRMAQDRIEIIWRDIVWRERYEHH